EERASEPEEESVDEQQLGEEERKDGKNHLAADIREKRHSTQDDHVRGEPIAKGLTRGHGITRDGRGTRPRSPRTRLRGELPRTSCSARPTPPRRTPRR